MDQKEFLNLCEISIGLLPENLILQERVSMVGPEMSYNALLPYFPGVNMGIPAYPLFEEMNLFKRLLDAICPKMGFVKRKVIHFQVVESIFNQNEIIYSLNLNKLYTVLKDKKYI